MDQNKQMAMVLPYKKKHGKALFLIQRKNVKVWDEHPDLCGIDFVLSETDYEEKISFDLSQLTGIQLKSEDLKKLGICGSDRTSDVLYHLYAVDMSRFEVKIEEETDEDPLTEHLTWVDDKRLLTSLDPQLITCYAKAQYLVI